MEYLSILLALFLVAFLVQYKNRLTIYHSNLERFCVMINIFVLGVIWDYFAIYRQHWIFPGNGLVGLRIHGLPIEEFLFFLIIPYVVLVMYKFYDKKLKRRIINLC